jgi:flagellar capping protein FliD
MSEKSEKTPYETNPVESLGDAICAFVEAFGVLQGILREQEETIAFADELRTALYKPVRPAGDDNPAISLYEIGAGFVNDGKYGINKRKLDAALNKRKADIHALFVLEENGILVQLCEMLEKFLLINVPENEIPIEEEPEPLDEFIHAAALRFLNECRRLYAMFG